METKVGVKWLSFRLNGLGSFALSNCISGFQLSLRVNLDFLMTFW